MFMSFLLKSKKRLLRLIKREVSLNLILDFTSTSKNTAECTAFNGESSRKPVAVFLGSRSQRPGWEEATLDGTSVFEEMLAKCTLICFYWVEGQTVEEAILTRAHNGLEAPFSVSPWASPVATCWLPCSRQESRILSPRSLGAADSSPRRVWAGERVSFKVSRMQGG